MGKENIYLWDQCQAPYLRAVAPGLVGGDHHISCHEEGAILSWGHHVVSLVPHSVIELPDVGRQGHGEDVLQRGLGVTLYLAKKRVKGLHFTSIFK